MPVLKTKKAMEELASQDVLEVLASDPGAKSDIPAWVKRTGNELLSQEELGGLYKFLIKKA